MIALWLGLAWAEIAVEPAPRPGVESVVLVTDEAGNPRRGETVRVVHRPATAFARERAIGITDGRGRIAWTPEEGGVAEVRAGRETATIRIAWDGVPAGTAILLGLLLLAGIGALGVGFVRRAGRLRGPRTARGSR